MAEPKRSPALSASSLLPLKPHPTPNSISWKRRKDAAGVCGSLLEMRWRRTGTGGQTMHGGWKRSRAGWLAGNQRREVSRRRSPRAGSGGRSKKNQMGELRQRSGEHEGTAGGRRNPRRQRRCQRREEVTGEGETVQERGGIQETGGCGEKSDKKD